MNLKTPRDWWESLDRQAFHATAKAEAPRLSQSKIGMWRATNVELDSPMRTLRRFHVKDREED